MITSHNIKKFNELVLTCIKFGASSDGKIPKTKLAKLVYLADFGYFYKNLTPISGVSYKKLDQGPVSLEFFDCLENFENIGKIQIEHQKNKHNNGVSHLISSSKKFAPKTLSQKELSFIKKVCAKWKDKKTQTIVDFTHKQIPWQISRFRDEIPYSLITQEEDAKVY